MANAEATRARILDAALAEFSTFGVAGARVDRIASTAGCNKNLIYVYFENKETLFNTVLARHLDRVYQDSPFTPDDLPGMAGRVFDFMTNHPELLRLLAWSTLEQSVGVSAGRTETHEVKIAAIAQAQQEGIVGRDFSAKFLLTAVMALATSWSPAFPFGSALHPEAVASTSEIREEVVRAITLMVDLRRERTAAEDKSSTLLQ